MKRQFPENLSQAFQGREGLSKENNNDNTKPYYAAETGTAFIKRFKLILRTGKVVSIPYAFLPVITLTAEKDLIISTHDLEIFIRGRKLHKISEALSEERVVWIRESNTSIDTGDDDVYVSDILIKGEWIQ
ncbi:MAG: hypothetical protein JNK00_00315 [Flavipsychrobacter sp.]|nr:hypothetical protein [Flavipsychrobacter sp.]